MPAHQLPPQAGFGQGQGQGPGQIPGRPPTKAPEPLIVCDNCQHPKKAHRLQKYYCQAELIQNESADSNKKVKTICPCTQYQNVQEEAANKPVEPPPTTGHTTPHPKTEEHGKNTVSIGTIATNIPITENPNKNPGPGDPLPFNG